MLFFSALGIIHLKIQNELNLYLAKSLILDGKMMRGKITYYLVSAGQCDKGGCIWSLLIILHSFLTGFGLKDEHYFPNFVIVGTNIFSLCLAERKHGDIKKYIAEKDANAPVFAS